MTAPRLLFVVLAATVATVAFSGAAFACSCAFSSENMYLPRQVTTMSPIVLRLPATEAEAPLLGYRLTSADAETVELELVDTFISGTSQWLTLRPSVPLEVWHTYALDIDTVVPTTQDPTNVGQSMYLLDVTPIEAGEAAEAHWTDEPNVVATRSHESTPMCGFEVSVTVAIPHDGAAPFVRADYAPFDDPQNTSSFLAAADPDAAWLGATQCASFRPFEAGQSYWLTISVWDGSAWAPATTEPIAITTDPI